MSINTTLKKFTKFSSETFVGATAEISIEKLKDEIKEFQAEVEKYTTDYPFAENLEEVVNEGVDCIMCIVDALARIGVSIDNIDHALKTKVDVNIGRKWHRNEDGTYSHDK